MATPRRTRSAAKPVSNIVDPVWVATDWTLPRALRTARFWWICLGYFCGLYIWYAVQVHQTKFLLDIGFSPNVGVWALGVVSLLGIPGQIVLGHASDRIGREAIWAIASLGFAICFAALIALKYEPSLWLVYLMVFTQGALGYGLTSIMGAVVLEIFQGAHYGSIFGSIMLAALAGGAAGPWVTGALHDVTGTYTIAFAIGIAVSFLSAFAIWRASPGKVRAVRASWARVDFMLHRMKCRSPAAGRRARARKLSAGVVSGSIRRCSRKPSSSASRIAPAHAGFGQRLAAVLRTVSTISVDHRPPRAQALGEFGPALLGARHEQDHFHMEQGRAAERILPGAVHLAERLDEIRGVLDACASSSRQRWTDCST